METDKDFMMLAIFADGLAHTFYEISILAKALVGWDEKKSKEWMKKAIFNNWIKQMRREKHMWDARFKLMEKGDLKYREGAIKRGGDYSWFKYFDRTKESAEKFMPLRFRPAKTSRDVPVDFVSPGYQGKGQRFYSSNKQKIYSYAK